MLGLIPSASLISGMEYLRAMLLKPLPMPPSHQRKHCESIILNNAMVVKTTDHNIDLRKISGNALKVLHVLDEAGFEAYLVGGSVRDLLLGMAPKDFDVATNASPEEIKNLFRNCRLIGRRFRLAHILFGREVIEVATFRADHQQGEGGELGENGRILRDNVFGTVEEDAKRRDFSINALYFSLRDESVVDFVGALDDIASKTLRLIGDPDIRFAEDPVRCLRAARFSAKLGFRVAKDAEAAMTARAHLLRDIPPARLFEEVLKIFHSGQAVASLEKLREYDLLQYLFPIADACLKEDHERFVPFLYRALKNTDSRIREGKPVTPAFLYAVMLWPEIRRVSDLYLVEEPPVPAILRAADEVVASQLTFTSLPKRFSVPMLDIWTMQPKLERYEGKRALRLMESARFRAGYDFLVLRSEVNPELKERARWWTEIQETHPVERKPARKPTPRKRRGRSRKPSPG